MSIKRGLIVFSIFCALLTGGSGAARAQTLSSAPFTAITGVSVTANWSSTFSGGTTYFAQISSGSLPNSYTGNQSSSTNNTFATFAGLSPSTVYFAQVSTLPAGGAIQSLYSTETSSAITPAAFTTVNNNYLTANWNSTFPAGTTYYTQLSTDVFPNSWTGNQSSNTFNLSVAYAGLSGGTAYYVEVATAATGPFTSLGATTTSANPAITAASFTTRNYNYFTANWTTTYSTGTLYYAQLSTGPFPNASSTNVSSNTFNLNAVFGSLSGSTLYYVEVATAATGPFTSLGSTTTLASPAITAAAFTAVAYNGLTSHWTTTYSTGTFYYAQLSSGAFPNAFTGNQSSNTFNLNAAFTGLTGSTAYFVEVGTAATGPFTSLGSTTTLPYTITGSPFTGINYNILTANWTTTFPGGTFFYAQISSGAFPNAFTGNQSSNTFNLNAYFAGLSASIAYFVEVGTAATGPFTNIGSTTTLANPIVGAAFTGVSSTTLTANWISTFSAGTIYFLQVSSGAFPNSFTGNLSSNTLNLSAAFTGLTPNTSYYTQVATTPAGPFFSTGFKLVPFNASISALAFTTVNSNYLTANWTTSYPAGTFYYANLSTGTFPNAFTGNQSSNTFNTFAPFNGLAGSVKYYAEVATATAGPFTSLGNVTTPAGPFITPGGYTAISSYTLTANWGSTFSTGTLYYTNLSSGAFPNAYTGNQSSNTLNLSASYSGLTGSSTYYAEVATAAAGPFTSLGFTPTMPPPTIFPAAFAVTVNTVTVNWTSTYSSGTFYYVEFSSGAFPNAFTGNQSSNTFNLSALFGNLNAASTYYAEVATAPAGPFISMSSATTLPATITGAAFSAVSINGLTANWTSTFPNGTLFYTQLSSGPFPNALASNQYLNTTNLFKAYASLSQNTTYYVQVATAATGPFTFIGAQQTLPTVPGAPGTPSPTVLSTTAINWSWSLASSATTYLAYEYVGGPTLLGATTTTLYAESGLAPNTPHIVRTIGYNASGGGPLSPTPATAYTLANPPAGTAASSIWATSATISWLLNSNPAGTPAEVQFSVNDATFTTVFSGGATQFVASGLLGCTTYYYGVRNWNLANVPSVFASTIAVLTANTVPSPASGFTASSLAGGQIALSWIASPTEGVTQYSLYYDAGTGTINYGAPLAVLASPQTSFTTGVLASTAAYSFALRTTHRCGVSETTGVFAIAGASATLSSVRAAVNAPASGSHIAGNNVTVAAALVTGTPAQTQSILFQYRVSGTTTWALLPAADINHPNPSLPGAPFVHWDVTGTAPGNYDVRAVAVSVTGSTDSAPGAVTVVVDPVTPTITESQVGGKDQTQQVVNNAVTNRIAAGGAAATDPLCGIILPPGALSASTVTFTVTSNPTITTGPPAGMTFAGSAMEVDLDNGQHNLSGGSVASITLSYPEDAPFPETFQIYSLNPGTGQWSKDFASTVNLASRTVSGMTPHFSIFAIIAGNPASADLSAVRVYPNPFKPNGGNPDEGKPFSFGDATSGIVFDNLPGVVTITIYTASGRMVAKFDSSSGSGTTHWDAKNQDGADVASGGYLAVISSPGIRSVVRKIAIIR